MCGGDAPRCEGRVERRWRGLIGCSRHFSIVKSAPCADPVGGQIRSNGEGVWGKLIVTTSTALHPQRFTSRFTNTRTLLQIRLNPASSSQQSSTPDRISLKS